MEDKIEVGEYVRVNNDNRNCIGIGRVSRIVNETIYVNMNNKYNLPVSFQIDKIVKHSKQLIDLIEKDDYVNGYKVINVINEEPCPSGKCVDIDSSKCSSECTLWEEDIKTILTKESYMANCYKVGGKKEI